MAENSENKKGWKKLSDLRKWRVGFFSSLFLLVLARSIGLFQAAEWGALDALLRLRPHEPIDERILIVGIDAQDIEMIGAYPVPDEFFSDLLQQLDKHSPRAVGLDVFRDTPVEPGYDEFRKTLKELPYVFGIEFLSVEIPPPPLPENRVGFSDFLSDADGNVRRSLLGRPGPDGNSYRFSLAIRLAEEYLDYEGISLENGIENPEAMRFGSTELIPFLHNTGGYINADANSQQILLNFRSGPVPFRQVPFRDVMNGTVDPDWIKGKVVLIGIIDEGRKDFVPSNAVGRKENRLPPFGVEMHAHATSQILSAVLDERPFIQSRSEVGEYLLILFSAFSGILLIYRIPLSWRLPYVVLLILVGSGVFIFGAIGYFSILVSWWIPIFPALTIFWLNGFVASNVQWVIAYMQLAEQTSRSRIAEGLRVTRQAYTAMHNGPLQDLAVILRRIDQDAGIGADLCKLDVDIRDLYDNLEKEIRPESPYLYLEKGGPVLDLEDPLHELLYQVYIQTIKRDFPYFQQIKANIVKFEPMRIDSLSIETKRSLCRFLQEVLCNVGRYAEGATRIQITCLSTKKENLISVKDNGCKKSDEAHAVSAQFTGGSGTVHASHLAKCLKGKFIRSPVSSKGTTCELRWPIS